MQLFKFTFIFLQACAIIFSGIGDDSNPHSGKNKRGPNQKLSLWEQYILTLIRLRLGFEQRFIGVLFGVSSSTVSRTFNSWINIMAKVCKPLLVWPSRDRIERHMPKQFKLYPKTRVIIDCTEVFVQKPRNPTAQAATYSTYKSHNTFKCLVGISPAGAKTTCWCWYTDRLECKWHWGTLKNKGKDRKQTVSTEGAFSGERTERWQICEVFYWDAIFDCTTGHVCHNITGKWINY